MPWTLTIILNQKQRDYRILQAAFHLQTAMKKLYELTNIEYLILVYLLNFIKATTYLKKSLSNYTVAFLLSFPCNRLF